LPGIEPLSIRKDNFNYNFLRTEGVHSRRRNNTTEKAIKIAVKEEREEEAQASICLSRSRPTVCCVVFKLPISIIGLS
jgi:hypothetical protein